MSPFLLRPSYPNGRRKQLKLVVIGNGIAGNTAAQTVRRLDRDAEITLVSDQSYSFYTACALPHYLAGDLSRRGLFVKTRKTYEKERIRLIAGRKVLSISTDRKTIDLENGAIEYDRLIVASGSRPLVPPIEGVKLPGVHTFKYLDDAAEIKASAPKTAVVVGTGPIGIEAGIALNKRGVKVYMIELMTRIMPRIFDDAPALMLRGILQDHGIEILTGERVMRIAGTDKVEGIVTDKRTITCDLIVMAAGMRPNSELAKEAGIGVAQRGGIVVDHRMATSAPDVYACGDCVEAADLITGAPGMIQLWHNAKEQGEVAGSNAAGAARTFAGSINITSLDVFNSHAVSFGNIHADLAQQQGIEVIEKPHDGQGYHRLVMKGGQIVGAQFIGNVTDMGAVLFALIRKDKLAELKEFGPGRPTIATLLRDYRLSPFLRAKPIQR